MKIDETRGDGETESKTGEVFKTFFLPRHRLSDQIS